MNLHHCHLLNKETDTHLIIGRSHLELLLLTRLVYYSFAYSVVSTRIPLIIDWIWLLIVVFLFLYNGRCIIGLYCHYPFYLQEKLYTELICTECLFMLIN